MSFPVLGFFIVIATTNLSLSRAAEVFRAEGELIGIKIEH